MSFFDKILGKSPTKFIDIKNDPNFILIKERLELFYQILDINNNLLKLISDLEEKSQGEFIFDNNYLILVVNKLESEMNTLVELINKLTNDKYSILNDKLSYLLNSIKKSISNRLEFSKDNYTLPLTQITRNEIARVGGKSAQLGEMKNILKLNVPNGFSITAWSYLEFLRSNNLNETIKELINKDKISSYKKLKEISLEIQSKILSSKVPEEIENAILKEFSNVFGENDDLSVSIRSSAINEDSWFSFAGQYSTYLGANKKNIIDSYKKIIAGKFSPKAIYYLLSHELDESDSPMSVCCIEMVDAEKSGVIYTANPINASDRNIIINSIYGLGKLLVDGTVTPDMFIVSKDKLDILDIKIAEKEIKLVLTEERSVEQKSNDNKNSQSLDSNEIKELSTIAKMIENHYNEPQDIEWAIDKSGKIFMLQTRPLRVLEFPAEKENLNLDFSKYSLIMNGGLTACPGSAFGKVWHINSENELDGLPENLIIIAEHPFPGLITALGKAKALITKTGGLASHLVTIAREYRIPTIVGFENSDKLINGMSITVDAINCNIYEGEHPELVEKLNPEFDYFKNEPVYNTLKKIKDKIIPLTLPDANDSGFIQENCNSIHDILRFIHQKSIETIINFSTNIGNNIQFGINLKSSIPLKIVILDLELNEEKYKQKAIDYSECSSIPFKAYWEGILEDGWIAPPTPTDVGGFMGVMATDLTQQKLGQLSQKSFAILEKDFMLLSLRMGYHFTSIESVTTGIESKNFIRMKFKEGGASFERRVRRIRLLTKILSKAGFKSSGKGDYLDCESTYDSFDNSLKKLFLLGRITMLTRQVDMVLKDDEEAELFYFEILEKLGFQSL